jgi:hypothetical protein
MGKFRVGELSQVISFVAWQLESGIAVSVRKDD